MHEIPLIAGPRALLLPVGLPTEALAAALGVPCMAPPLPMSRAPRTDAYGLPQATDTALIRAHAEVLWRDCGGALPPVLVLPDLTSPDPAIRDAAVDRLCALAACLPGPRFRLHMLSPADSIDGEPVPPAPEATEALQTRLAAKGLVVSQGEPIALPADPALAEGFARNLRATRWVDRIMEAATATGLHADRSAVEPFVALQLAPALPAVDPADPPPAADMPLAPAPHPSRLNGKRLLFVIEKLGNRSGGAERCLIDIANAFAARGFQVEIASHEHSSRPPFYPTAPGVVLSNLRPPNSQRSLPRRIADRLRALFDRHAPKVFPLDRIAWTSRHGGFHRRLRQHLKATRPDVVIGYMPPAISAVALARAALPADFPIVTVASTHNVPEQDFHNPARWDPSPLDQRRRLRLIREIDAIAVLMPEYRDWYDAALKPKIHVIPNAVARVDPAALAGAERQKRVIAVGRLAAVKRHDLLLQAWARLSPEFPDWSLQIYGIGPLEAELRAELSRLGLDATAAFMGHTSEIAQHYLSASILAHPAEFEGFPLAVTEALASGLPVVGFDDCSGLNRLVVPGSNGVLVASDGDRVEAFTEGLRRLMADPAQRAALSHAAPASVAQYGEAAVLDMWERLFVPEGRPAGHRG